MGPRTAATIAVVICGSMRTVGWADENKDLDLIPPAAQEGNPAQPQSAATPTRQAVAGRLYGEEAFTASSSRGGLVVPFPPPAPPDWQNRISLDASYRWDLTQSFSATLSDRMNLLAQPDFDFPSAASFRNDFREGYLTWEPAARNYLEAGRINVRNGVALGFNPTDFFKTRTLIDQASLDPSVIRQDRLGTVMARAQTIWSGGSASFVFAPKLYEPTPIMTTPPPSLDPNFDLTNAADRWLVSANYEIADLSPQALIYHESGDTRFGLNLSRQIGNSIVAYAEWAGGRQRTLIVRAVDYGKETGTLPPSAPILPPSDTDSRFRNDLAVGASWSSSAKFTLNLEYHYHQAGFSRQDWQNWFAVGSINPAAAGEVWYVRGYANDQQEPVTRHQVFARVDWRDAFISHLELSAFAFVNLYDGSTLAQISASYYVSNAWTVGAYLSANVGGAYSERGSLPQAASAIVQLVRYF